MNVFKQITKKMGVTALVLLFCSLFANSINAAAITWNGGSTGNWSDGTKWSTGTVPGSPDIVTINNGTVTLDVNITIIQLKIGSIAGGAQGKLTISSTKTLTVTGLLNNASILLTGGFVDILSGGTVTLTSLGTGSCIAFNAPTNTGATPSTGLTNAGTLTLTPSSAANAVTFNTTGVGAIPTIDFGTGTTVTLADSKSAINVNAKSKGSITGTLAVGTVATPTGGILYTQAGDNSDITFETGANLSFVGTTANGNTTINLNNTVASTTLKLTNKGTISISGNNTTTSLGLKFAGSDATTTTTFDNQGTFTANLRIPINGNSAGNFELKNSGVSPKGMYLTNPATTSPAILFNTNNCTDDVTVTNSGTLDMKGTSGTLLGSKGSLTNTGTITTDFEMAGGILITINNNTNGVLNFTGLSSVANTNAIPFAKLVNGGGTINTGKSGTGTTGTTNGVNIIGLTNTYTSGTLSPGGTSFMSIMNLKGGVALPVTLEMQVSGATTAGTDYDQILATGTNAGFNLNGATLNLTSAYTPGGTTAIDVVKPIGTGTITCTTCTDITSGAYNGYKILPSTGVSTWSAVITPTGSAAQLVFPAVVLPIELVSFTATPLSKTNKLTWATATETNNKGFDIQRQTQTGDWASIGFVAAQGKAATYTFDDNAPLPISYYRLRQVDFDGTETLSKIVSASQNTKGRINITPNPTSDKVTVRLEQNDLSGQAATIALFDMTGKQVLTQKTTASTVELDLSNLAKGMYLARIQANNAVYQEKIVRQ